METFTKIFLLGLYSSAALGQDFKRVGIDTHNSLRARHGSPPLVGNATLDAMAQKWASYLASTNQMKHECDNPYGCGYGENIAWSWGGSTDPSTQVKSGITHPVGSANADDKGGWYEEIANYDFNNPGWNYEAGHFTQVVWKNTKSVGFGYATNGEQSYVVARYYPSGNVNTPEQFQENVRPPK